MKKQLLWLAMVFTMTAICVHAQQTDTRWGDLGDGTFANPVLNADMSDPDVIRVDNKYYLICSEFHFMGMNILESDDMVNWKIIGRIYNNIDMPGYSEMKRFAEGTWAPALRYHNGKYYIFVCMPKDGLFMTTATKPEGPWEPLYCVKAVAGWEDPCPFWDEDGQAYLGHSKHGAGPIIVHKMSADGKQLLDDGQTVYQGPVAEGTKFLKKDGYYYLSIPEGGVGKGWQMALRSKSIYGPYEGIRTLEQGSTDVNGPHQGALVDTPNGEWWFYHFQQTPSVGRVLHLEPVIWKDGFPFIGKDYDGNGIGEPMKIVTKPNIAINNKPFAPQSSDNFNAQTLGFQWQFNHNPDNSKWSLTARKGWLCMTAINGDSLRNARNQFTQKIMGYKGEAVVKLDFSSMTNGQRAGLECIGRKYCGAGVMIKAGRPEIYLEMCGNTEHISMINTKQKVVYLKLSLDNIKNTYQFSYSFNGKKYDSCGNSFTNTNKDWKGTRIGLYSYTTQVTSTATKNDKNSSKSKNVQQGKAYFDNFSYLFDGPGGLKD